MKFMEIIKKIFYTRSVASFNVMFSCFVLNWPRRWFYKTVHLRANLLKNLILKKNNQGSVRKIADKSEKYRKNLLTT